MLLFSGTAFITVSTGGVIFPLCFVALTVSCCVIGTIRFLSIKTAVIFSLIPLIAFFYTQAYSAIRLPAGKVTGTVYAEIDSVSSYFSGKGAVAFPDGNGSVIGGSDGIKLYLPEETELKIGDVVRLQGVFTPTDTAEEIARGEFYTFSGKCDFSRRGDSFFTSLRRSIGEMCGEYLDAGSAWFVKAVTIADRSEVAAEDSILFSKAGASHVLAVSGLHLSIVVMLLYSLIKRIFKNRAVCFISGTVLVFCFCALAGFPYSAVRSGIMLCIAFAASAISANNDPFTSLFAALGAITLFDPYATVSLSLQLSFLCTLGLICVSSSYRPATGNIFMKAANRYILTPLITSLAVVIFTLPATLDAFGHFSLLAPLSMLVCILLFPLLLGSAYLFYVFAAIMPFTAKGFGYIVSFISKLFISAIRRIGSLKIAASPFYKPIVPVICAACAVLALAFICVNKARRKTVFTVSCAAVPLLLCAAVILPFVTRGNKVCYADTFGGYGAAVASGRECVFIDSGSAHNAADAIWEAGFSQCETLVITSVGKSTPEMVRLFARAYGTHRVYFPKAVNEAEAEMLKSALASASAEGCVSEVYTELDMIIGDVAMHIDKKASVVHLPGNTICIAKKYIYDGAHKYDTIVLPSAYYPGPKGSIDLKARYYCVNTDFPAGNTTFIKRNECVTITP